MPASDRYAKTEPPTPKRRKEARERGTVARSPEIGAWVAILAASLLMPLIVSEARSRVLTVTTTALGVAAHPSPAGALAALENGLRQFLVYIGIVGGAFMAIGLAVGVVQVGRAASLKAARPRFSRVSPKAGLKRVFSPRAGWELAKSVLKLTLLAAIGYVAMHGLALTVASKSPATLAPLLDYAGSSLLGFVRVVAILGLAIGAADYAVQRRRLNDQLKMTKQEVKDERRTQEGDPQVRQRLRRRSFAIARSKTIAAVRTADVVVTNPTHFAVAIQYDPARASAPRVVAKGIDSLALRMREEAVDLGIPVVEDPPLARYLHATCDVDQLVPVAVYVAVAQLIAFVYSLPKNVRGTSAHRRPYSIVPEVDPDDLPAAVAAAVERRRAVADARAGAGSAA